MTNTEISDNNPEKELIIDKSISDDKTKQISKKNTTQNKKIAPKNDKPTKSFMELQIINKQPIPKLLAATTSAVPLTRSNVSLEASPAIVFTEKMSRKIINNPNRI
jgi:hypothetical protein